MSLRPAAFSFKTPLEEFEREGQLGQGGMATVWRARHRGTGAKVALKIVSGIEQDPTLPARFQREARAMAELRHPNVGRVLAYGQGSEGLFLAMELIDGGTVRDLKRMMGGALPVELALEIFAQLLAALEHAHENGVVHRDLKPQNIMLSKDGVVKLVDFGIAKGTDDTTLTQTGAVIGTPAFMSPEQAEGDDVDARSDLFSAGLVLFDMISGKSPFHAENATASLARALREEVPLLCESAPGVPWHLERVYGRMVERDRSKRPASAGNVLQELLPLISQVRLTHSGLLAAALARPDEMNRKLRRTAAAAEVARGDALVEQHGAIPAAALAFLEATRVDPAHDEASKRLARIASQVGLALKRAPEEKEIQDVVIQLKLQPRQAALWRRLADLRHERGELAEEAIALKRALRLRNEDDVRRRLAQLLLGPRASLLDVGDAPTTVHDNTGTTPLVTLRRRRTQTRAAVLGVGGLVLGAALAVAIQRALPLARHDEAPRSNKALSLALADELVVRVPNTGPVLDVAGTLTLGGALRVELAPDATIAATDRFVIAQAGAIRGTFADGAKAKASPRGSFTVVNNGTTVVLTGFTPD